MTTYTQLNKINARHKMFFYSIDLLTTNRNKACCVERSYVRKILDYFLSLDETKEKDEASKIDMSHVKSWETLHDSCVGFKRPEDLVVCYLSGPEPQNDFNELISLGIHPQNIWAFEMNSSTYNTALANYGSDYPQPKIIKQSIEHFFVHTPKKFDIVYIDACGSIASEKQVLRIIATLCKYHRLNSPGIIVSNFACPDLTKGEVLEEYSEMITQYLFCKQFPNDVIDYNNSKIHSESYITLKNRVKEDFHNFYSELITNSIIDIAALAVPIQRFVNSSYIGSIVKELPTKMTTKYDLDELNSIKNNSLLKFSYLIKLIEQDSDAINNKKIRTFIKGFSGLGDMPKDLFETLNILYKIKNEDSFLKSDIEILKKQFDKGEGIYQYLDKPNSSLLLDVLVNQLSYPLHYNSNAIKRYKYKAKNMEMFMDVIVLDECRYIYEWLPSLHQIQHAFSNLSWQYVFRFALDGLIKQRISYNNEYFFQGSVISKEIVGFENKTISKRETIE
ncbi:hypothetical protein [Paenibacillus ihumii]|uniref:hypothetical protein n=1 Tax=Paenibacillus ihumii TaxID=687436 RepID=UPI0006D79DA4|nr:hypothetical protein [Paenibacillus ihumii]